VDGYLGPFHVVNQDIDLCNQPGIACPIKAGEEVSVWNVVSVPSYAPAGATVHIKAVSTNGDGSEISCMSGTITLAKKK